MEPQIVDGTAFLLIVVFGVLTFIAWLFSFTSADPSEDDNEFLTGGW